MKIILATATLVLVLCGVAAAGGVKIPLSPTLDTVIEVDTLPETGNWQPATAATLNGGFVASCNGGYILSLFPSYNGAYQLSLTRTDKEPFQLTQLRALVSLPLSGIAATWDTQVPPFGSMFRRTPEIEFTINTRPNVGIPLTVLVDHYGNNRLTAGFIEQDATCEISGERSGYNYTLGLIKLCGDSETPQTQYKATLYLNESPDYWFKSVQKYTAVVDSAAGYTPKPIPAPAYEPVYSTVYPFDDRINEEIVWNNAVEASKLGMRQILIDVGWSHDLGWADSGNDYGAYQPSKSKFPDFAGLVKRIHDELGMRVILWVSPTWIGRQSTNFEQVKDYRVKWPDGDYDRNLCPRTPEARKYLAQRLSELAKTYEIDGLWIDFLDTCPTVCDAPHNHDTADFSKATGAMLEDIYTSVARANKNATIEYRVPYSNLFVKPYANVFETTDSPKDFNANRLMGIFVRAYSKGVVVKGDPAYWADDAHCEEVARHCMTSIMLGVPTFSVDLVKMDNQRKEQIKAWLGFYNTNRIDLLQGEFTPFGASFHNPDLKIVSGKQAFVYLCTQKTKLISIEQPVQKLHILNVNPPEHGQLRLHVEGLSDGIYTGRYYDCSMHSDREEEFTCENGRMQLHTDMPTGGMLTLIKK